MRYCLFLLYNRGNLVKAKWIPTKWIVELQSPAVSNVSLCLLSSSFCRSVCPPVPLNIPECCFDTGEVLADNGLFCWWQATPSPWRSSLPDGVCEWQVQLVTVVLCFKMLSVTHLWVGLYNVNRGACRCFTRTCRCPSRMGMRDFYPQPLSASSSIR